MSSKAKFGFAGLTTVAARTKQKVIAKVGKAEDTVDIGFKQENDKFEYNYKILKKLAKDIHDFTKSLRSISDGHRDLGESISTFYDSGSALWALNQQNQAACIEIDKARQELEQTLNDDVVTPVDKYLGQYKQIDKRCSERNRRRVDMDRYHTTLRHLQQHPSEDPAKLAKVDGQYQAAKRGYEELNAELMKDMMALYEDRTHFFDPLFATIVRAQATYYARLQQVCQNMVGYVQNIDGKAAHNHISVITDDSLSCANKAYGGADVQVVYYNQGPPGSAGGYGQPSYGQPAGGGYQPSPASGPGYGAAPGGYGQPAGGYQPSPASAGGYGQQPPAAAFRPAPGLPGRPPAAPPRTEQAQALYQFNAESPTELSFTPGQVLNVLSKNGDWWEAELNGRRGLVPANYLQLLG